MNSFNILLLILLSNMAILFSVISCNTSQVSFTNPCQRHQQLLKRANRREYFIGNMLTALHANAASSQKSRNSST